MYYEAFSLMSKRQAESEVGCSTENELTSSCKGEDVWISSQKTHGKLERGAKKQLEISAQNFPFSLLGQLNQGFSSLDIAPKRRQ